MLVKTHGSAVQGINAQLITVEVDVGKGVKSQIIGLPDNAVRESLTRVYAALKNTGFEFPRQGIIVNMAPADLRKEGSAYDLTIALGILAASNQLDPHLLDQTLVMGELSLDGTILPITGSLPMAIQAAKEGFHYMLVPEQNAREAAVVQKLKVLACKHLRQVVEMLQKIDSAKPVTVNPRTEFIEEQKALTFDFSDVKGQKAIKRAMEIAAAGGHNILLIGPPGAGKTMLAKRLSGILPPMNLHEALETTKIHSVAGKLGSNSTLLAQRPFRSPHHTISDVALVGGGNNPQPGEISLAHNGVLFLDELPEFKRTVLEVLRQPLEERRITISRARFTVDYPSNLMLVASMNPCPCGYFNHPEKDCVCAPGVVQRYLNKISGPLLDRIDLHVEVTPVKFEALHDSDIEEESSSEIRERVIKARARQEGRYQEDGLHSNAQMETRHIREYCELDTASSLLIKAAMMKLHLSARAYDRILKVARTIADLAESEQIKMEHLAEAIQYRSLDRQDWGG